MKSPALVCGFALLLVAGCLQDGLALREKVSVELQIGERAEFLFTLENTDGKEYTDFTVEFVDDKWLVRTMGTEIDKPTLKKGDSAVVRVILEGAKVGTNDNARLRLTYSDGGKEFRVPLTVKKDPNSNLTFKLSSLSPMELLAFNARCGGG
jgi:hypothetical protein